MDSFFSTPPECTCLSLKDVLFSGMSVTLRSPHTGSVLSLQGLSTETELPIQTVGPRTGPLTPSLARTPPYKPFSPNSSTFSIFSLPSDSNSSVPPDSPSSTVANPLILHGQPCYLTQKPSALSLSKHTRLKGSGSLTYPTTFLTAQTDLTLDHTDTGISTNKAHSLVGAATNLSHVGCVHFDKASAPSDRAQSAAIWRLLPIPSSASPAQVLEMFPLHATHFYGSPVTLKNEVLIQNWVTGKFLAVQRSVGNNKSDTLQLVDVSLYATHAHSHVYDYNWILNQYGLPIFQSWLSHFPPSLLSPLQVDSILASFTFPIDQKRSTNASSSKVGNDDQIVSNLLQMWPVMTRGMKERVLLEDLVWCLTGFDGMLVKILENTQECVLQFADVTSEGYQVDSTRDAWYNIPITNQFEKDSFRNSHERLPNRLYSGKVSTLKFPDVLIYVKLPLYNVWMHPIFNPFQKPQESSEEKTVGFSTLPVATQNDDAALTSIVRSIATVCTHQRAIGKFLDLEQSSTSTGMVNHAFCAAVSKILSEFSIRIAQIETRQRKGLLTLQSLRVFVQPALHMFSVLHKLVKKIYESCHSAHSPFSRITTDGLVLNCIFDAIQALPQGDSCRQLCEFLLSQASVPLCKMIEKWIYKGVIDDPYSEFFIEEDATIDFLDDLENFQRSMGVQDFEGQVANTIVIRKQPFVPVLSDNDSSVAYWTKKFVLLLEKVPYFFESVKDKILLAGKYLNVIESCRSLAAKKASSSRLKAAEAKMPFVPIRYSSTEKVYLVTVEKAFLWASKVLNNCFINDFDLFGRLEFMKSFFLLSKSDFLTTFMDNAATELDKHNASVSYLDSLLDLSIRSSSSSHEKYREDVSIVLHDAANMPDISGLLSVETPSEHAVNSNAAADTQASNVYDEKERKGQDSGVATRLSTPRSSLGGEAFKRFSLSYTPRRPLNLFFSSKCIFKYQIIFRLLAHFKWVERKLHDVWRDHMMAKELISLLLSDSEAENRAKYQLLCAINLREKMLHFCKNFIFYVTIEVIEPCYTQMLKNLKAANNLDEMMRFHEEFLNTVLVRCLLTDPKLLASLTRVLSVCHMFARHVLKFSVSNTEEVVSSEHSALPMAANLGLSRSRSGSSPLLFERRKANIEMMRRHLEYILQDNGYLRMIQNASQQFERNFEDFFNCLTINSHRNALHHAVYLLARLEYDAFLSTKLFATEPKTGVSEPIDRREKKDMAKLHLIEEHKPTDQVLNRNARTAAAHSFFSAENMRSPPSFNRNRITSHQSHGSVNSTKETMNDATSNAPYLTQQTLAQQGFFYREPAVQPSSSFLTQAHSSAQSLQDTRLSYDPVFMSVHATQQIAQDTLESKRTEFENTYSLIRQSFQNNEAQPTSFKPRTFVSSYSPERSLGALSPAAYSSKQLNLSDASDTSVQSTELEGLEENLEKLEQYIQAEPLEEYEQSLEGVQSEERSDASEASSFDAYGPPPTESTFIVGQPPVLEFESQQQCSLSYTPSLLRYPSQPIESAQNAVGARESKIPSAFNSSSVWSPKAKLSHPPLRATQNGENQRQHTSLLLERITAPLTKTVQPSEPYKDGSRNHSVQRLATKAFSAQLAKDHTTAYYPARSLEAPLTEPAETINRVPSTEPASDYESSSEKYTDLLREAEEDELQQRSSSQRWKDFRRGASELPRFNREQASTETQLPIFKASSPSLSSRLTAATHTNQLDSLERYGMPFEEKEFNLPPNISETLLPAAVGGHSHRDTFFAQETFALPPTSSSNKPHVTANFGDVLDYPKTSIREGLAGYKDAESKHLFGGTREAKFAGEAEFETDAAARRGFNGFVADDRRYTTGSSITSTHKQNPRKFSEEDVSTESGSEGTAEAAALKSFREARSMLRRHQSDEFSRKSFQPYVTQSPQRWIRNGLNAYKEKHGKD